MGHRAVQVDSLDNSELPNWKEFSHGFSRIEHGLKQMKDAFRLTFPTNTPDSGPAQISEDQYPNPILDRPARSFRRRNWEH
jgi:hypothetical protein